MRRRCTARGGGPADAWPVEGRAIAVVRGVTLGRGYAGVNLARRKRFDGIFL